MNQIQRPNPGAMQSEPLAPDAAAALTSEVIEIGDAPSITPDAPLSQREIRTIIISLVLTMFLTSLDQTIVATALPTIGQQFQDVTNLSWVITAYLLSSTAVAPVYGTLSDIYGRRTMILFATCLFLFGSVLCAVAPNLLTLILARALQGLGGGGILPLVQTVVADIVSPRERGRYQGYFSSVWVIAGIGGPVLGGFFAEHMHWSMIFWINLPMGLFALALLVPKLSKLPVVYRKRKVDWLGGGLLMAGAVVVLLVLTWGGHALPWLSPVILSMIGSVVALGAVFIWHARRTDEPFLPIPLITGPVVPYAMVAGGCAVGTNVGMTVSLPLYYQSVYDLSATASGLALIPTAAVVVMGAWVNGRAMVMLKHYKRPSIIGAAISMLIALGLAFATPLPLWLMLTLLAVFAFGLGAGFPLSIVAIQNAVARSQVGTATGAMNFFRSLMASFAVAVFSAILFMALGRDVSIGETAAGHAVIPTADMVAAFRYVFLAIAAFAGTTTLLLSLMEERPLAGPAQKAAAGAIGGE